MLKSASAFSPIGRASNSCAVCSSCKFTVQSDSATCHPGRDFKIAIALRRCVSNSRSGSEDWLTGPAFVPHPNEAGRQAQDVPFRPVHEAKLGGHPISYTPHGTKGCVRHTAAVSQAVYAARASVLIASNVEGRSLKVISRALSEKPARISPFGVIECSARLRFTVSLSLPRALNRARYAQKYARSLHSSTIQVCSTLWRSD